MRKGITNPEERILSELRFRYAANIDALADSVDDSVAFYRLVKSLPSSSTRFFVENSLRLHVNGPHLSSPNIFTASYESSRGFIIKLFSLSSVLAKLQKRSTSGLCFFLCC